MAGTELGRAPPPRRGTGTPAAAILQRLGALAALSDTEQRLLSQAVAHGWPLPARRTFAIGQDPIAGTLMIASGWAARVRQFADGRRQVLGLFLPGDIVPEAEAQPVPRSTSFLTVTELLVARAPEASAALPGLAAAYRESRALRECHLLRQVARLGQLDARERIFDWLSELRDRMAVAGLVRGAHFALPTTQELIGDTLGLTSVHVNRTLQAMRREGLIDTRGGDVAITGDVTTY